ncbi:MAG: HAD-IC family P-type ATPase [Candidatus Paceibacterota bacterium]
MNWYKHKWEDVLVSFEVSVHGLASEKVLSLREKYGYNKLSEIKKDSLFSIFFRQFRSPVVYVLLIAAVAVFLMGDVADSIIIFVVLIVNAIVGTFQEGRAQNTLTALRKMVTTYVTVLRDEKEKIFLADELVPGDIILLTEGDKIPADARLMSANNFKVDESALTGESEPITKNTYEIKKDGLSVADQINMVFNGTYVIEGEARAVVVSTGVNTVIGKISKKLVGIDSDMPLKKSIKNLSRMIILSVLGASAFIFLVGVMKSISALEMFSVAVAVAVSAIPEGLPVVVTIILATGMYRMSKKNALVRKLQAVEALGQAEIIAVDKTGTITLNQMMVKKVYVSGKSYEITGNGYEPKGDVSYLGEVISPADHLDLLFLGKVSSFVSGGAAAYSDENKMWQRTKGDPTEVAMSVFSQKIGFNKNDLEREHSKIFEIPFNSHLKYHAVGNNVSGGRMISVVGAPEIIISRSKSIWKEGKCLPINNSDLKDIHNAVLSISKEGLRVIGLAMDTGSTDLNEPTSLPDLCFVGFVGISDSIREEVSGVISSAKEAGVKVIMITGDHIETAKAIGRETGIYSEGDIVMTGAEMADSKESKLLEMLPSISIFARVTPEDKLKIIELYHKDKKVIAMTGDGVNDALSLAAADLGVSMGKIGTEVAKESSDIILQDDNFGSILSAIEEGRNIYITIKKVIFYLFSTSSGEVFTIVGAILLGYPLPILASQIIWLNFVTDGFLVTALSMEPKEKDLLSIGRRKSYKLVDSIMMQRIIIMGLTMMIGSLFLFDLYYAEEGFLKASTVTLTALAAFQWLNIFNSRFENKTIFSKEIFSNLYVWGSLLIIISLQVLAVYFGPLQSILKTTALSLNDWILIIVVSLSIVLVEELRKALVAAFSKNGGIIEGSIKIS